MRVSKGELFMVAYFKDLEKADPGGKWTLDEISFGPTVDKTEAKADLFKYQVQRELDRLVRLGFIDYDDKDGIRKYFVSKERGGW